MRNTTICTLIAMLFFCHSHAQGLLGMKAGLNYTGIERIGSLPDQLSFDESYQFGYHFGIVGNLVLNEKWAIRPELLYSLKGFAPNPNDGDRINLHYLALPVLASFSLFNNFYLEAGLETSYLLHAKAIAVEESYDVDWIFDKKWDIGISSGARFYFLNHFHLGARYTHGLTDIQPVTLTDINGEPTLELKSKNRTFQVSIGYELSLKK